MNIKKGKIIFIFHGSSGVLLPIKRSMYGTGFVKLSYALKQTALRIVDVLIVNAKSLKKEAIDFGGFSFARENLAILDNLQRAHNSIKNGCV